MLHRYLFIISFFFAFGTSFAQVANISRSELLDVGLPVVEIFTVNGELPSCDIVSGADYGVNVTCVGNANKVPGRLTISTKDALQYDSGDYEKGKSGMTIKIRGNGSGKSDKKPYKIKLQKKADLLYRNDNKYENKDWVLIFDQNYRNMVGFKVNELMGLQWTPAYEYVNVMINGKYQGIYMLLESVERDKNCRLNVSKSGYIFEYDMYWWKEDLYVQIPTYLPWKMYYTFKYPESEDMTEEQLAYFKEMIAAVEASIKDGTYPDYIDLYSFASWMLAHDILGTSDGSGSNIFLTKYDDSDNSKVMMANLWDLNSIFLKPDNWSSVHNMFYFKYLFTNNPNDMFIRAYRKRWDEVSPTIFNDLDSFLDEFNQSKEVTALNKSAELDNELWKWERKNNNVNALVLYFKRQFNARKTWLTTSMKKFPSGLIKGDVNGDYSIDYDDIVEMVNAIMCKPSGKYNKDAADMNNDKKVNAADIVLLVGKIKK